MSINPYQSPKVGAEPQAAEVLDEQALRTLSEIRKEAINSLVLGIASITICLLSMFAAPAAIMYGRRTRRLIRRHNLGHQYETYATIGITMGYVMVAVYVAGILPMMLLIMLMLGFARFG